MTRNTNTTEMDQALRAYPAGMLLLRTTWRASVSLGALLALCTLAHAQSTGIPVGTPVETIVSGKACSEPACTKFVAPRQTYSKTIGENTERETRADAPPSSVDFSISVDGQRVAGDAPTPVDAQRKTDLGLEAVDIQVKYDGLDQKPILNVSTMDVRRTYRAGDTIQFLASTNYRDWLTRQEVLIYPREDQPVTRPRPIVIPVDQSGRANWRMPAEGIGDFTYVLRVYDKEGRFDETVPLPLARTDADLRRHVQDERQLVAPGRGDDRTAFRNIPVYGGAVTVYGRNVPKGYAVRALGENVPLDKDNAFVVQQILPPGDHVVNVAVDGEKTRGVRFDREINIPSNDWFYIGLADLTVGRRTGDKGIEAVRPGEYDKTYTKGRAAFYLKGKIKGQYLLTASADTREDKIGNLFKGLDAKDPRNFLTRINPDEYYPVYGDDSTAFEDAPTRGKFYVRLERGDSRVMWGNFKTNISGSQLLRNERALYGANMVYNSESKTSFGESKVHVQGYVASADTLPQRDVLRATGGSAYFLKYQDITVGSEVISIEIRDRVSGRVLETRRLVAGVDYEIDSLQGVVILKRPLSSTILPSGPTRTGAIGDDDVFLIAQYEHTPTAGDVSGSSFGGRAQGWLGEHVRIGATGMKEETGQADQKMVGGDIILRRSDSTYLQAEVAQTEGPGFGRAWSTDGGSSFNRLPTAGAVGRQARAYSVRGQVDLADITKGPIQGTLGGFYERKDAGFSSIDYDIVADQRVWGAFADLALTKRAQLHASYEDYSDAQSQQKREGTASLTYRFDDYWKASVGVNYVDIGDLRGETRNNQQIIWTGRRADVGARLTYSPSDDASIYVFGQGTVARSGNLERNDRIGIGGEKRLTDKIGIGAEISYGTKGVGALAAITYDPTVDRTYYIGYRRDPDSSLDINRLARDYRSGLGGVVLGTRQRYNDEWSGFAENNVDIYGKQRSLATTYGVTYTPNEWWTMTGGFEGGRIRDPYASDFDRWAPSLGLSYKDKDRLAANLKVEGRFENSRDGTRDQTSYYFAGGLALKISEDWRALANIDAIISDSNGESVRDGNYIDASIGAAYRPIANDRFNALFKYAYLQDLPSPAQVSAVTGTELGPLTRAHILSVDGIYDLNRYLSIGAKYGFRISQSASRDDRHNFYDSSAHLGVLRADLHVVRNWDVLAEGRVLYSPSAGTTDWGAVAAVYRHLGDNLKVGVGYNFGVFSDDLRDQTLNDRGVFLNVIGKF